MHLADFRGKGQLVIPLKGLRMISSMFSVNRDFSKFGESVPGRTLDSNYSVSSL